MDRHHINLAFILCFTDIPIKQGLIGWRRKQMIWRWRGFIDPLCHFCRRFGRTSIGRAVWRSLWWFGATALRAANDQEEGDQATK
jgi:hypothetical protein